MGSAMVATAGRLMEEFEVLARTVRSSENGHTFSAAQGVTVVWNSPVSEFRNSVVANATVCHDPEVLPQPGIRFLSHVERFRCKEVVYGECGGEAFTQHWDFIREGFLERYSYTKKCSKHTQRSEFVFDTRCKTTEVRQADGPILSCASAQLHLLAVS